MAFLRFLPVALCLLAASAAPAADVELMFLANGGFLLRSSGQAVLIDGLLERPSYGRYGALPADVYADAVSGAPPFDNVKLLLVSHEHDDHLQSAAVREFLRAHPDVMLVSSPQVVERIGGASERVIEVWPEPGEPLSRNIAGVQVEFMALSHGTGSLAAVQNIAHVIHVGGKSILHVGDADMNAFNFTANGLGQRQFDVAILPYWYFQLPAGQSLVRRHIRAAQLIAAHVPPEEVDEVKAFLATEWPEVDLLVESLETRRY